MSGYTQLPADWAAVSGVTQILNKPTLSTVSVTGEYTDILGLPLISTCGHSGLYSDLIGQYGRSHTQLHRLALLQGI